MGKETGYGSLQKRIENQKVNLICLMIGIQKDPDIDDEKIDASFERSNTDTDIPLKRRISSSGVNFEPFVKVEEAAL